MAEQSNELSKEITESIIYVVQRIVPHVELSLDTFNHIVRKTSHFFCYFILGILVLNALRRSGVLGYSCIVYAFSICIFYAALDEIHQLFVPGRGGQVIDFLIDSFGSTAGIIVYLLVSRIFKRKVVINVKP